MGFIKIFEEFVETSSIVTKLQDLLRGYIKTIKRWFTNGAFSKQNEVVLYDIQLSENTHGLSKSIIFDFSDGNFLYQIIFTVRLEDYDQEDGKFKKCELTIKKYTMLEDPTDSLYGDLLDRWSSSSDADGILDLSDFNEEYILQIINDMSNENQATGSNEEENSQMKGDEEEFELSLDEEGIEGEEENIPVQ